MRDYKLGEDVYLRVRHAYAVVTAAFYYEDVIDKIEFDRELDKNFPGWKKKPIYVVTCYSDDDVGLKYIAVHDAITLTSELN